MGLSLKKCDVSCPILRVWNSITNKNLKTFCSDRFYDGEVFLKYDFSFI